MKTKGKVKEWTMWLRPKGTFGIAHLLKETVNGVDTTICGMEYDNNTIKKTDGAALRLQCQDCDKGTYNDTDVRSSKPISNV